MRFIDKRDRVSASGRPGISWEQRLKRRTIDVEAVHLAWRIDRIFECATGTVRRIDNSVRTQGSVNPGDCRQCVYPLDGVFCGEWFVVQQHALHRAACM